MLKYAIIQKDKTALIFEGTNIEWAVSQGFTEQEVEQSDKDGGWYLKGYAPMKTDDEKAQEESERRIREIKAVLSELDLEAIRPLRAILAGKQTEEDLEKIKEIETKAVELRAEYRQL